MTKQTRKKITRAIVGIILFILLLHPILMDYFSVNSSCCKMYNIYTTSDYESKILKRRGEIGKIDTVFYQEIFSKTGYVNLDKGNISFSFVEDTSFKEHYIFDTTQHINLFYTNYFKTDKWKYFPFYKKIHYKGHVSNCGASKSLFTMGNIYLDINEFIYVVEYEGTMTIKGICSAKKAEELIKQEVQTKILEREFQARKKRIGKNIIEMLEEEKELKFPKDRIISFRKEKIPIEISLNWIKKGNEFVARL